MQEVAIDDLEPGRWYYIELRRGNRGRNGSAKQKGLYAENNQGLAYFSQILNISPTSVSGLNECYSRPNSLCFRSPDYFKFFLMQKDDIPIISNARYESAIAEATYRDRNDRAAVLINTGTNSTTGTDHFSGGRGGRRKIAAANPRKSRRKRRGRHSNGSGGTRRARRADR